MLTLIVLFFFTFIVLSKVRKSTSKKSGVPAYFSAKLIKI